MNNPYLKADWPAPKNVHAIVTTRQIGVSKPPFDSFNLATHVGENPKIVATNRQQLQQDLDLQQPPCWLTQVHSTEVVNADHAVLDVKADASFSLQKGKTCAVLTADCLPILLCDEKGRCVAAVHAGWRGLAAGIIAKTVATLPVPRESLLAWLGPAISSPYYEVGDDVRDAFLKQFPKARVAFTPNNQQRWNFDLYQAARLQLLDLKVSKIYGGEYCTFKDKELFYSYRREEVTGRMASLIWMK